MTRPQNVSTWPSAPWFFGAASWRFAFAFEGERLQAIAHPAANPKAARQEPP